MATYSEMKIFRPEAIRVMMREVIVPERLYSKMYNIQNIGLHSLLVGRLNDSFLTLPQVGELEDARNMLEEEGVDLYELNDYRGFKLVPNKIIEQFTKANNMDGLLRHLQQNYIQDMREAVENTNERVVFDAINAAATTITPSVNWTTATSADILKDIVNLRKTYMANQFVRPTHMIVNPDGEAEILNKIDMGSQLVFGTPHQAVTGQVRPQQGMEVLTQLGGYVDSDGVPINLFPPTTAGRQNVVAFNPKTLGYPVAFGEPEITVTDDVDKEAVKINISYHAGFVYNRRYVSRSTS